MNVISPLSYTCCNTQDVFPSQYHPLPAQDGVPAMYRCPEVRSGKQREAVCVVKKWERKKQLWPCFVLKPPMMSQKLERCVPKLTRKQVIIITKSMTFELFQLVTRAPAGCMCRPCTAVEVKTFSHFEIIFQLADVQDNSIMASELAGFVDAGQLVNSYGPVRFTWIICFKIICFGFLWFMEIKICIN